MFNVLAYHADVTGLSRCNGLDVISSGGVSTGTAFRSVTKPDLHSAMLSKQALLGLLRAGKGSIRWGQFGGLGWKNW